MSDKKISELTDGSPGVSTDEIPIDRAGANYKVPFQVTESQLNLADNTTANVSTSKHGLVPKLPNDATKFLDGTGAFSVPAGGGGGDTLNTVAASGATQTIDFATADVWDITLSANCTFTLSGFTSGDPDFLTLILRQDGTGSRTVTWPTITWIGSGIAPTLQTAASSVDSVVLFSFDGGTTVFGIAQTSASGLRSGTSFPGSPSDGDLFYRTDRRILYEYVSAVTKWLSLDRKYVPFGVATILQGGTTAGVIGYLPIFEDVYIESWQNTSRVVTTNNGSNFWTVTLFKQKPDTTNTVITSFTTASDTAGTYTNHGISITALVDSTVYNYFSANLTKTGTPGAVTEMGYLILRSVG